MYYFYLPAHILIIIIHYFDHILIKWAGEKLSIIFIHVGEFFINK